MISSIAYVGESGVVVIVRPNEGFRNAYRAIRHDGVVMDAKKQLDTDFVAVDRLVGAWPPPEGTVIEWAETEEEFVARVQAKDVPATASDAVVLKSSTPKDRTFRNAWAIAGTSIVVDMSKARVIHMDKIRVARNEKLATLDGPWMRAFARGQHEDATKIEAQREALRNLPQTLDLTQATTPEALAAIWPDILK